MRFISVVALLATSAAYAGPSANPSIFVRYQYDVSEIVALLDKAQGKALDPKSVEGRWLDEMGWRKWVKQYATTPFEFTPAMRAQLAGQEKFLRDTFTYQVGDVVWTPAERGEAPYGHSAAKVNPRGVVKQILKGEKETYFVVEVGVDNGAQGGMHTVQGKYYDGHTGPVLDYGPNFNITKKTYVYSLSEMERFNGAFRSQSVGSDTGITVDYTKDVKWLAKMDQFKDKVVAQGLEVDYTKTATEIYTQQKRLIKEMFNHFKMNRNSPVGGPLLGDLATGGGVCFHQACVLAHGVHAVGEPYGIRAMNISGQTVNPSGGHGFVRITVRGPEEVHVYDVARDATTGAVKYRGMEIKSNTINFISDPGWADYGTTPDYFSMMPVEDAINPKPVDANRAVHELLQGKSFEEVVVASGGKGPLATHGDLHSELFAGSHSIEFISPRGQITEAPHLEKELGGELGAMVDKAKALKATVMAEPTGSARGVKSRIFTDIVEGRAAQLHVGGLAGDGLKIALTEYLFRAIH